MNHTCLLIRTLYHHSQLVICLGYIHHIVWLSIITNILRSFSIIAINNWYTMYMHALIEYMYMYVSKCETSQRFYIMVTCREGAKWASRKHTHCSPQCWTFSSTRYIRCGLRKCYYTCSAGKGLEIAIPDAQFFSSIAQTGGNSNIYN